MGCSQWGHHCSLAYEYCPAVSAVRQCSLLVRFVQAVQVATLSALYALHDAHHRSTPSLYAIHAALLRLLLADLLVPSRSLMLTLPHALALFRKGYAHPDDAVRAMPSQLFHAGAARPH